MARGTIGRDAFRTEPAREAARLLIDEPDARGLSYERDLRAAIGEDVRTSYATATAALRQAIYIRDQLLPAAQEAFRAASASYSIGGSSAFEVIDARRTLLDAQSQYSDALAAANISRSELERAIGARLDSTAIRENNAK